MERFLSRTVTVVLGILLALTTLICVSACQKEKTPPTTTATATTTEGSKDTTNDTTVGSVTTAAVTTEDITMDNTPPSLDLVNFDTELQDVNVYNNPLVPSADMGDPFCMRYDGKYYLYCSVGTNSPVYVRTSTDLVKWSGAKACVEISEIPYIVNEHGTEGYGAAYAPEVTYFNGKFYMVTSFGGMGHYTYVADSPEGPFKRATDNWGRKIDGDIFIDNDGVWRFYSANGQGILCFDMYSPTEVVGNGVTIGAIIDNGAGTWTEGSMIVYHDGIYYLTYTGNHVCHTAYRINYGTSTNGPTSFKASKDNPLLVSTTGAVSGIGHSSSVKGPDLDSYYIVYHTRDRQRYLNIDRLVFNGLEMTALGPTVSSAAVPNMPDIYAFFDEDGDKAKFDGAFSIADGSMTVAAGNTILAKDALARDTYTIEVSTNNIAKDAKAGVVFGYKDDKNYGKALFDTKTEELLVVFVVDGKETEYRTKLVRSFNMAYDFNAVHAIQVEKKGDTFTFYVDDRELCKHTSALDGTKVGVVTEGGKASFGYVGAIAVTGGDSAKEYYKPVASQTGYLLATHCREYGYETDTIASSKETYIAAKENQSFNYAVYAEKSANYDISVYYKSKEGAVLSIFVDGEYVKDIVLDQKNNFGTAVSRIYPLTVGEHVITVFVKKGDADILYYKCLMNEEVVEVVDDFSRRVHRDLTYTDGVDWGILSALIGKGVGKRLYGDFRMGDYTVSADFTIEAANSAMGLLVRTQNPGEATFTKGDKNNTVDTTREGAEKGANWMQGYYIELTNTSIALYKCNFTKVKKASETFRFEMNKAYNVKVICEGANFKVFVDGELIINYTDPEPYTHGMAGLRAAKGRVVADNFVLTANAPEAE